MKKAIRKALLKSNRIQRAVFDYQCRIREQQFRENWNRTMCFLSSDLENRKGLQELALQADHRNY